MATLDLVNLTKRFGTVAAVDNVQLTVSDGEFMCILGPSGCGKSTLLRMVAGFEMPTGGDIRIDRESVTALSANRRPTAMVFQKYTLWPHMKVYDNIAFGLQLRKLSRAEIKRKVEESLALVTVQVSSSVFNLAGKDQPVAYEIDDFGRFIRAVAFSNESSYILLASKKPHNATGNVPVQRSASHPPH